jgi:MFS family permease
LNSPGQDARRSREDPQHIGTCIQTRARGSILPVPERRSRAFGIFYTCTIGAGAISPSLYGMLSDWVGVSAALVVVGLVVLTVLPLSLVLRPALRLLEVQP